LVHTGYMRLKEGNMSRP